MRVSVRRCDLAQAWKKMRQVERALDLGCVSEMFHIARVFSLSTDLQSPNHTEDQDRAISLWVQVVNAYSAVETLGSFTGPSVTTLRGWVNTHSSHLMPETKLRNGPLSGSMPGSGVIQSWCFSATSCAGLWNIYVEWN